MKKKLLATILSATMLLSFLPLSAFAYSTNKGDTASYLMNVYDEPTAMLGSNNGKGVNSPIHYASNDFAKTALGTYGNNQYIYVKEFNGETFIELDMDEAKLTGNKQIRIYFNAFDDLSKTTQTGVDKSIDTTYITHLAYRVKITGGTKGVASNFTFCWGNGLFSQINLSRNGAYLIDYATREIYTPGNWSKQFVFTDEFDGWIVVPFECIYNSSGTTHSVKDIILGDVEGGTVEAKTAVRDIQVVFYHNGTTTDWTNRNLYLGDVLILEDPYTFNQIRTSCELLGHDYKTEEVAATCTEDGYKVQTCKYCGHTTTETYTAYGHNYDAVVTAPTDTEAGYTTHTCANCGDSYTDSYVAPINGKVNGVTATADGDTITITWDAFKGASKYIVYVIDNNGNTIKTAQKFGTSAAFANIDNGEYTVKVIAKVGSWFKSSCADAISVTVADIKPSSPVANDYEIYPTHAVMNWDAVEGATKYVVMVVGNGKTLYRSTTTNSITLCDLVPETEYTIYVNAKTENGYLGYGEGKTIETTSSFPDLALTALPSQYPNGVKLEWNSEFTDKVWIKAIHSNGWIADRGYVEGTNTAETYKLPGRQFYIIARYYIGSVPVYIKSNIVTPV